MLNYIWAFMILVGVVYAAFTGNMKAVTEAMLTSSGEAVTLCITMTGILSFWMGLMKIAERAGVIGKLSRAIQPFLTFLFPDLPKEHEARQYIATNFIANILGLGWACTPAGLKAMEALAEWEKERLHTKEVHIASKEMCTFLIINISSLQLIPVNMIVYRTQYGSVNPAAVIGPSIIATLFSTIIAIIFCKIMSRGGD